MASCLFVLLSSFFAFAQELQVPPVVVEATTARSLLATEPTQTIQVDVSRAAAAESIDELLRSFPGIHVVKPGGPGQTSSIFIRGASSSHTLVLVDGFKMNDPSQPSGEFNFASVDLTQIERIEIYKGPNALRFGSGAMSGVINIVTKEGSGRFRPNLAGNYGSYDTLSGTLGVLGANERWKTAASLTDFRSRGFSAASESRGANEDDGHRFRAFVSKLQYKMSTTSHLELIVRGFSSKTDLDYAFTSTAPYVVADDPNYEVEAKNLLMALRSISSWGDRNQSMTTISHVITDRRYRDDPDFLNSSSLQSHFKGRLSKLENVNEIGLGNDLRLNIGPSVEVEAADSYFRSVGGQSQLPHRTATLMGAFGELGYFGVGTFASVGIRYDHHSLFGSTLTTSISPGYRFEESDLTLRVRSASGFKAPALSQLYEEPSANDALKPERSQAFEATVEKGLPVGKDRATLSAAAFHNRYEDLIRTRAGRYQNLSSARAQGFEISATSPISQLLYIQTSYTYTDARDEVSGRQLDRQPYHMWSAGAEVRPTDQWNLRLDYRGSGKRNDVDPIDFTLPVKVAEYSVFDASISYSWAVNRRIYLAGGNLLDSKYEEAAGYSTRRRSFTVGAYADF